MAEKCQVKDFCSNQGLSACKMSLKIKIELANLGILWTGSTGQNDYVKGS